MLLLMQIIFNLIQNNEGISKAEMAIRIGKSEKTVQRLISSLMKKQVIEREGSNKSGSWKIKRRNAGNEEVVFRMHCGRMGADHSGIPGDQGNILPLVFLC